MATDLQILQALRAAVNAQLTAAGQGTVSLVRLGNAINRGLQRINIPQWTVLVANTQWKLVDALGSRVYVIRTGGANSQSVDLHIWSATAGAAPGAAMHVYSGTPDADSGSPLDGLASYYQEVVDPALVTDDATAVAWLTNRITAGLPAVP